MGGNAFLTPSHRLTTPQLDALLTYTQTKLSPLVPGPIEPTRCFKSKSSHGDLDVQVGCYTAGPGWKANASSGPDTATICPPSSQRGSWKKLSNTDGAVWSAEDTKVFLDELAMALRAKRWLRHGDAASFAVPCGVLGGLAGHYLAGEFYQLDILFVPPPILPFANLIESYGVTALLLSSALRRISSSFTLHSRSFVIRHTPFFGLKPIEITLTTRLDEFIAWTGLDLDRWKKGFEDEEAYWRWIALLPDGHGGVDIRARTNPDEVDAEPVVSGKQAGIEPAREALLATLGGYDKHLAIGWRRQARRKPSATIGGDDDDVKIPKGHGAIRMEVLHRFREWLRGTIYVDIPIRTEDGEDTPEGQQISLQSAKDSAKDLIMPISTLAVSTSSAVSPTDHTIGDPSDMAKKSMVDPDLPSMLDAAAEEALKYFGKKEGYELVFATRREEARVMAERQRRRVKT